VSECERILVEQGEGCIPVVSNYSEPKRQWRLAGLMTRGDILQTHEFYRSQSRFRPVSQFLSPPPKVRSTPFDAAFFASLEAAGRTEGSGASEEGGGGGGSGSEAGDETRGGGGVDGALPSSS